MRETVLNMLRHHPFVAEFEPRHVERLAGLAKEVRFERDQILFREGDDASEFYLIVNGLVALEIAAPGHTFRVQTLFAGDEMGWSALLMGRGKHFQARTLDRVDALAFEGGELLAACNEDTAFGYTLMSRLLAVVAERLQATRLQLLDTYSPIAARAGA
ncbi:MAG TPA: Crp/Fnr family transcriptional regulator [Casimicrobiaceae bacterium]|nr:Crp/Fnr family transcriptional regulator [Casimicrobiaceae bacterium]